MHRILALCSAVLTAIVCMANGHGIAPAFFLFSNVHPGNLSLAHGVFFLIALAGLGVAFSALDRAIFFLALLTILIIIFVTFTLRHTESTFITLVTASPSLIFLTLAHIVFF